MIGMHYQKHHLKEDLILITTPEGEMHEIGILASSLLCVHYGIKFIYLGSNLPAISLAEAVNALHPKTILLGTIKGHEIGPQDTLESYLDELQSNLKTNPQILVGGNLKPYIRSDLEKRRIPFFPTLQALDEFLVNY
jgi:methanogenic corrinoid protein MtbC1